MLERYTIRLPGPVYEAVTSRDGRRIAWLVEMQNKSPFVRWVGGVLPLYRKLQRPTLAIYVSDLDGKQLHEVGALPQGSADEGYTFTDVRWLPGDRRLSFTYKDRLWIVSVD